MSKTWHDSDPKELFEAVLSWYETVYNTFIEFRDSDIGKQYKDALDDFLHDAHREAGNIRYALDKNELPERGRASLIWKSYNRTYANIRLMQLILELARN